MGLPHSVSSVSQFSSVGFGGPPEPRISIEFLKGPRADNETWPFGPILKALTPNDAADREDLQLTPPNSQLSSVGRDLRNLRFPDLRKILSILAPARRRLCAGGGPGRPGSRCGENRGREF